ncbi:hypothetical protein PV04_04175 [Phialophora macrospora]|uniref:DUF1996 domain-containing protein n=1 Tax=Phialophora macrospora TaxID=1851006 RepID=A0A0D2FNP4_9EURO|nr:hypothetical protein PV04_04175 [Phialophora macrospora]
MTNPRVKIKAVIMLLASLFFAGPANAFFRHLCHGELGNGRVDPIVAPGNPSQHLHVIFGASNMGLEPTLEELLASNCTSCSILQDHSAYWTPRMYFQHGNGTLEMIRTSGGLTVYYFTERDPVFQDPITAFPQNFRMIAGNPLKRAFLGPNPDPPMSTWNASDKTQPALMEKALGFNCLNYSAQPEGARQYHYLRDKSFLDAQCADGIRAEVMFPSCWNGKDLDSEDHTSHVVYPSEIQNGQCPDGYPVRLPTLFYETIYQTNLFAGMDGQFTFSNGDPTGYGYHGDFVCAWDAGVLQSAIDSPACNLPQQASGNQDDCPIFDLQEVDAGTQCKMEIPEILQNEPINLIQQLPGNVQIQAGPGSATIGPVPGATAPAAKPVPTANTTEMFTPATPTPGPTASTSNSSLATTLSPCTSKSQRTTTTAFMSNGVMINLVLVEEVVTVTLSDAPSSIAHVHRRGHKRKHGHQNGPL